MGTVDDIFEAVSGGDTDRLIALLDRGANPNTPDSDGEGPLHWAVEARNHEIMRVLLNAGADPDLMGLYGTPLHEAVRQDDTAAVVLLLERGASVCSISDNGETGTPLHHCISAKMVELLISSGAGVNDQDSHGHTPLHETARDGLTEAVEAFLGHGADPTMQSHSGWSPLHWSVWEGQYQATEAILRHVSDPSPYAMGYNGSTGWTPEYWTQAGPLRSAGVTAMQRGWTPLHLAAMQGFDAIASLLLDKGADVNADSSPLGTPLRWAELMGHPDTAALLRGHGGR